jgi:uncharacterized membrane protein SirB2
MISYEVYKLFHLFFILTLFSSLGFVASSAENFQKKSYKILIGLISFLIMVAGMGLIARIGFKHGQGFPLWIYLKFIAWILVNILFVFLFKLKSVKQKQRIVLVLLLISLGTIWVVLNKPL